MKGRPYATLGIAVSVHFLIMWALTYVGVARLDHVFLNLNRFYMAVVMVAPMVIVMLAAMSHMFENKRLNMALYAISVLVFVGAFVAIRSQALIGDRQLSRSMIPQARSRPAAGAARTR
jgi:NADH:ubiquinone oxidoreductase subunit 2 (subunit N)